MSLVAETVTASGFGLLAALRSGVEQAENSLMCVAFAHERGVRLIAKELESARARGVKPRLLVTTVFGKTGSTKDALSAAEDLGMDIRIHNHPGGTYHPKLYLGASGGRATAVIGSANLTAGLACNIEVAVHVTGPRAHPVLARAWEIGEELWSHPRSEPWNPETSKARREAIAPGLLAELMRARQKDPVFMTLGPTPRPNRLVELTPSEAWVETERTLKEGTGPQSVPAWMLNLAWEYLRAKGSLSNTVLLRELRVHRSSAVCALLARTRQVDQLPARGIVLRWR